MTPTAKTVSPGEAAKACAACRETVLLDVRTPSEFREIHIDGARLVPLDKLDAGALAGEIGKERACLVICRMGPRAFKAADQLAAAGMTNVTVLEGGMIAWDAAGLPVVRGEKGVIPVERQVRIAAGGMVVLGVVLGALVHPGFYGLSAFVGAGLVFAGLTDWCGMGLLLSRAPWNK